MLTTPQLLAILAGTAAAAPTLAQRTEDSSFIAFAIAPNNTDIDNRLINAFDGSLWIGKQPVTEISEGSSPVTETVFRVLDHPASYLYLDTASSDAQDVYVSKNYLLEYYKAGTTAGTDPVETDVGFTWTKPADIGTKSPIGTPYPLYACPYGSDSAEGESVYHLLCTPNAVEGCVPITADGMTYSGSLALAYE